MRHSESFTALTATLKRTVATLRDAGVPFVVAGSVATWARGGPEPQNDLDLMLKPSDAEPALRALAEAGMRTERPPEEWLYKAWDGDVLVDVIFEPAGVRMSDEVIARADMLAVMAVQAPVMALEDVLMTMLCALDEHTLDYSRLVAIARSLREQVDWPGLWARTSGSPYARAFRTLVEGLHIEPPPDPRRGRGHTRVRVIDERAPGTTRLDEATRPSQ
jgi:Uncharacterised nucleotidyltransferase